MIEKEKYYTLQETADFLSLSVRTISDRCKAWKLECSNISETDRKQFRIKGENILNILNK